MYCYIHDVSSYWNRLPEIENSKNLETSIKIEIPLEAVVRRYSSK